MIIAFCKDKENGKLFVNVAEFVNRIYVESFAYNYYNTYHEILSLDTLDIEKDKIVDGIAGLLEEAQDELPSIDIVPNVKRKIVFMNEKSSSEGDSVLEPVVFSLYDIDKLADKIEKYDVIDDKDDVAKLPDYWMFHDFLDDDVFNFHSIFFVLPSEMLGYDLLIDDLATQEDIGKIECALIYHMIFGTWSFIETEKSKKEIRSVIYKEFIENGFLLPGDLSNHIDDIMNSAFLEQNDEDLDSIGKWGKDPVASYNEQIMRYRYVYSLLRDGRERVSA